MERESRTRLVTGAILVVVFASGLVLGAAVQGNLAAPSEVAAAEPEVTEEPTERRVPMYEQVGPTAEQSVLIDAILVDYRARRDAAREEVRVAAKAEWDATSRELILDVRELIIDVFDEEQAAEYRALLAESDRRRAEREAGGDGN